MSQIINEALEQLSMNIRKIILCSVLVFSLCNCSRKKIDLAIIENKEIRLERYKISEITSVHEFIDITNKRWNKTERIYEGNPESIDSVYIKKDTVILTTEYDEPIIYDLSAIKFGYRIKVQKE